MPKKARSRSQGRIFFPGWSVDWTGLRDQRDVDVAVICCCCETLAVRSRRLCKESEKTRSSSADQAELDREGASGAVVELLVARVGTALAGGAGAGGGSGLGARSGGARCGRGAVGLGEGSGDKSGGGGGSGGNLGVRSGGGRLDDGA